MEEMICIGGERCYNSFHFKKNNNNVAWFKRFVISLISSVSILVARTIISSAQTELPDAKTCIIFSSALITFTSESVLVEIMNFSAKSFFLTLECSSIYFKESQNFLVCSCS